MSEENVASFKRATEATNRRDVEGVLEAVHPEVEWHAALEMLLGREAAVYRGHEGVRELFGGFDDAFAEFHFEYWEIRDLGDRILAIGQIRGRGSEFWAMFDEFRITIQSARAVGTSVLVLAQIQGRAHSGVPVDTPWGAVFEMRDGLCVKTEAFLDHKSALQAAGLRE
jgi:ketosteroid isomerase-like protein